jgi:hypothetical protein
MGLYHSVGITYGFEIPARTDIDDIDRACFGQPDSPDSVGYIVVGDCDQLLLVTRNLPVTTNAVMRLVPDALARPDELAAWKEALHNVAVRLGLTDHPAPAWLAIHNYR